MRANPCMLDQVYTCSAYPAYRCTHRTLAAGDPRARRGRDRPAVTSLGESIMSLTPQQLAHYETFGFIIQRGLLSSAEMSALTDEFERKLDTVYSHMPFDDSMRHWSGLCLGDDTPLLLGLTEDPRFVGPAKQMYGDDVLLAGVDANRYTSGFTKPADDPRDAGLTAWHPDHGTDENQDCYGVKMVLYLEPTDANSGALRLVIVHVCIRLTAGIGRSARIRCQ